MRKFFCLFVIIEVLSGLTASNTAKAQSIAERLRVAVQEMQSDTQMRYSVISLCVADAKTGNILFGHNQQIGIAPASTQKIVTSAAAFEMLGGDFRYETQLGYTLKPGKDGLLRGDIFVIGSGDPTFGSKRYRETVDTVLIRKWAAALRKTVRAFSGNVQFVNNGFSRQAIPDGWIWQDIGNYYGAGSYVLNWKENQFDVVLHSGENKGEKVEVLRSGSDHISRGYDNELRAGAIGSGDNAYIYLPVGGGRPLLKGTIPAREKRFTISGAYFDPAHQFANDLMVGIKAAGIQITGAKKISITEYTGKKDDITVIDSHLSPTFDSINYWFMRRSINLYGEAILKTIAKQNKGIADTYEGAELVKDFWSAKGISRGALNIIDGSGLSPQNRVTTEALVRILLFARSRSWYHSFFSSLPVYNSMKLKSGSIGGSRAFAGYHTSASGVEYVIAVAVNNYSGSSADAVRKIYKVLDLLK